MTEAKERSEYLAKRAEYARAWRASEAGKASVKATLERHRESHPRVQWEITLRDGRKQYATGRDARNAIKCIKGWVSRDEVVSCKVYGAYD